MSVNLFSIGTIALATNEPLHRVKYAILSRKITPAVQRRNLKLYDEQAVAKIKKALVETKAHQLQLA
jgi:hypothetical protein